MEKKNPLMGVPGVDLETEMESVSSADLINTILTVDKVALLEEVVGRYELVSCGSSFCRSALLLFSPKYQICHPENYSFLLSK